MVTFKNNLEKSIFETVAYFDVFDYPLTSVEIWKWLWAGSEPFRESCHLSDILKILEESDILKPLVSSQRGFYFLKGRENLVEFRQKRYNLAEDKFKKALKVAYFLRLIPGIKMIAVCNDLAFSNAPEKSDIDFFIIAAKNKIWTARFLATSFLKICGLRPSFGKTQNKICLSFFVDEEHLNLKSLAISQPDIYLIYWIMQIAPIYDCGGIYEKFIKNNEWVKKYLPNSFGTETNDRRKVAGTIWRYQMESFGKIFRKKTLKTTRKNAGFCASRPKIFEKFFRWLQLKVMSAQLKEMANKDTRVIVSNTILKFHTNDRREEYKKKWEKKITKLLSS